MTQRRFASPRFAGALTLAAALVAPHAVAKGDKGAAKAASGPVTAADLVQGDAARGCRKAALAYDVSLQGLFGHPVEEGMTTRTYRVESRDSEAIVSWTNAPRAGDATTVMVNQGVWRRFDARTPASEQVLRVAIPVGMLVLAIVAWEVYVLASGTPKYILPSPVDVVGALAIGWPTLLPSLWVTLSITFEALFLALIGGVGLAIILVQSKWIELALFPFAVVLQVTPIVAIAPLLLIYTPNTQTALQQAG